MYLHSEKLLVQNLSKIFDDSKPFVEALKDISFSVLPNEIIVLLGPSGCGKTTLLRIIGGLERSTKGKIFYNGAEIFAPQIDIGIVFQDYTSFPWLSVYDNIDFGLKLRNLSKKERNEIVKYYIQITGLTGFENSYPKNLSGGMKQRVAIARTLATNPSLLLLDEPFGALDSQTRALMGELLLSILDEYKATVLFVTHDIEEAIFLGDRIYIMSARPGHILNEFRIPFQRPRSTEIKISDEFIKIKSLILKKIRKESLKAAGEIKFLK